MAHKVKPSDFDIMLCGESVRKEFVENHARVCPICFKIRKKANERERLRNDRVTLHQKD